ncbi:MAG: hypothetical protein JWN48_2167 [Myxococcaceae bacterium]|nr:hypothetical protein [Myxococcaceae bacterium]
MLRASPGRRKSRPPGAFSMKLCSPSQSCFGSWAMVLRCRIEIFLGVVLVLSSARHAGAQESGGGGDPATGDTAASDTAASAESETFATDDAPPGAESAYEASVGASPSSAVPARQYGRSDPFLPLRLDGHVALTWDGSFGVGVRADFPLISGTFRYSSRDELAISVGSDVTFISFSGSHAVQVFPTAVLQWSLGLNERTFLYPELGLFGHINDGQWKGLHPNIGFGIRHYLHRSLSLQGRLGWPIALSAGVTF